MTALPERCFCTASLRIDEGLIICASGHVYALESALPAAALDALGTEDASG